MDKQEIYPSGCYSKLDKCPKCGDRGSFAIVDGKPSWVVDCILKNDKSYEYVCGHCFFRWIEGEAVERSKTRLNNNAELLKHINKLEDNYQKLQLQHKKLADRIKILEESKNSRKINIPGELDGVENVKLDENILNLI